MMEQLKQGVENFKHWIDLAAVSTGVATIFSWLPHVAAVFTVVWCYYRVKEIRITVKLKELELRQLTKD
jgi:hypothetical protein